MQWARKKDLKRLHKALDMPDHETRMKAVIYLGIVKDESSLPFLRSLINDPNDDVTRHAAHAIESINPEYDILPAFKKAIKRRMNRGENERNDDQETYVDYKAIHMYSMKLDQRGKIDRFKAWAFAILVTIGLAAIIYIAYGKL